VPGPTAPVAVPASAPAPAVPAAPAGRPALVSPYPGPGAFQTNAAFITRYQSALTWLAHAYQHPDWDPQGVDGKYGPHTSAAVKAFQAAHGLAADGQAGAQTASVLDAALLAVAA
jgi:hypothetical protein